MYVNFTTVRQTGTKGTFFIDSLKIKSQDEFLISLETSFKS